jgi:hypothetical protein
MTARSGCDAIAKRAMNTTFDTLALLGNHSLFCTEFLNNTL